MAKALLLHIEKKENSGIKEKVLLEVISTSILPTTVKKLLDISGKTFILKQLFRFDFQKGYSQKVSKILNL